MADKKVNPKNPSSSKTTKKDDADKGESRKNSRVSRRKSSGLKKFH